MNVNSEITTRQDNTLIPTLKAGFYALLLYIPTLYFARTGFLLLYPVFVIVLEHRFILDKLKDFKANPFSKKYIAVVWFPLLIIIFAYLNKLFNSFEIKSISDLYAPFVLLPLLIVGGHFLQNKKIAQFFIFLVLIETVVCFVEYLFSVRTFFTGEPHEIIIHSKDLLYDSRVYGLSVNSSIIGLKLFCTLILLGLANFSRWNFIIVSILIILGILVTFNRAVVFATLVFLFLLLIQQVIVYRFNWRQLINSSYFNLCLAVLIVLSVFNKQFFFQFSRGNSIEVDSTISKPLMLDSDSLNKGKEAFILDTNLSYEDSILGRLPHGFITFKGTFEITNPGFLTSQFLGKTSSMNASGRDLIWANYSYFIENRLWLGNGSDKLMLVDYNPKTDEVDRVHAHNSYLMLLSSNGMIISLLWIIWLVFLWNGKNFILIVTVLLYSLFQYGIFWGFSLLDVIFVSLIMSSINFIPIERKETNTRN